MIPDILQYFLNDIRNFPKWTKDRRNMDPHTPYLSPISFKKYKKLMGTSMKHFMFHISASRDSKVFIFWHYQTSFVSDFVLQFRNVDVSKIKKMMDASMKLLCFIAQLLKHPTNPFCLTLPDIIFKFLNFQTLSHDHIAIYPHSYIAT